MHYYINWALCNLSTFILPGRKYLEYRSQYTKSTKCQRKMISSTLPLTACPIRQTETETGFLFIGFLIPFAKPKPVRIKPCEPVSRRFTAWKQDGWGR